MITKQESKYGKTYVRERALYLSRLFSSFQEADGSKELLAVIEPAFAATTPLVGKNRCMITPVSLMALMEKKINAGRWLIGVGVISVIVGILGGGIASYLMDWLDLSSDPALHRRIELVWTIGSIAASLTGFLGLLIGWNLCISGAVRWNEEELDAWYHACLTMGLRPYYGGKRWSYTGSAFPDAVRGEVRRYLVEWARFVLTLDHNEPDGAWSAEIGHAKGRLKWYHLVLKRVGMVESDLQSYYDAAKGKYSTAGTTLKEILQSKPAERVVA